MDYKAPFWQFNGHFQTIYPSIFRKIPVNYQRQRITLPDGDFLDLDWSLVENKEAKGVIEEKPDQPPMGFHPSISKKLVIVTHGLEGDSTRHYVTGMVRKFNEFGYDGLGWNCRSCSGEINRVARFYHHGDAEDLRFVLNYALQQGADGEPHYQEVILVGFSMGGSLTLRLLGEKPHLLPQQVKAAIAASVPLDLPTSVVELYKPGKRFYMERFLRKLGAKIKKKSEMFPENQILSYKGYEKIKDFHQFDTRYTAPLHGYEDADDFYARASVKPLLKNIRVPALIVQAKNDPFLSNECLDLGEAENNKNLHLEVLSEGGHVGFMLPNSDESYVENRAVEFVKAKMFYF